MPLHPLRRAIAVAFCISPLSVFAQNAVPQLDDIVVTASRAPQALDDAMGDITVVGREELQRAGGDSVAEILSRQPGVQITNSGGPQTLTGIMLRGANTDHTLVMVDGMRINSSFNDSVHWNAIDPAAIERIEILRGAASSLYGSDAIGGVINIITRKGEQDRPFSAWGNMGFGSHETFKSSTGFSGAAAGWDYSISASMADSGGYEATNPDNINSYYKDKDGYNQHSLAGSLGYRWAEGQHLGLSFYNSYINGDYDAGDWASQPSYALTRQQAYSLTSTNTITAKWQSVLRLGLSKESYDDRAWDSVSTSLQRSYSWQNNFQLTDNHKIAAYVERLEERPTNNDGIEVTQRNTNSVGAVYNGRFGRHSLQASLRNDNVSGYGNEVTGGLGYDLAITDAWTVGIAGSTGFKTPNMRDLYGPWVANPDLKPEKSRNFEAHARYQKDGLNLGATIYQNKIRDLIIGNPANAWLPENINRATIRGATLTAGYEWENTTLRGTADFMRPRNDETGKRLQRRAQQQYLIAAEQRYNDLRVGAEYQFTGHSYDDAANNVRVGGYSLVNLTAGYDFSSNVAVQVRWNNILDKDYNNLYGYETPGSNFFINLSVRM
ncbi:TonB-dependent receptor [Achromobacter sp. F4_2707]|uniref:TonB-dependent receptor domain-containing protein n=1 Tax=Achromobacter sp. F4_2707 TaxID=3114286 RepID=UPI0039C627CC